MTFTSVGGLHQENVYEKKPSWVDKDKEGKEPTPISSNKYGPGFTIMQKKGYDGCSGLGPQKKGIIQPVTALGRPYSLGLGFKPFVLGLPNTESSSSKEVNASNNNKASKNTQPKPTQFVSNTDDLDTSLGLGHIFSNSNSLPVEYKHVAPLVTQTNSSPWIETF